MPGVISTTGFYSVYNLNQGIYTVMSYNDAWPLHPDGPSPFTEVDAFAIKTGFRGVVSWSTEAPILHARPSIDELFADIDTMVPEAFEGTPSGAPGDYIVSQFSGSGNLTANIVPVDAGPASAPGASTSGSQRAAARANAIPPSRVARTTARRATSSGIGRIGARPLKRAGASGSCAATRRSHMRP